MPAVQLKRFEAILERMLSLTIARSDLSDVTDTSVFKHLLAACAREIDECYYQMTRLNDLFDLQRAAGADLDARAKEIQPGTLRRIRARKSVGQVRFSRNNTSGDVTIPNGTMLKTPDGKLFSTTLQGSILDTQATSTLVPITAVTAGAVGNVASGQIKKFGAKIPGVDAVTNPAATSQGRDDELDDSFRQRIRNYVASLARCPVQALEFAAVGAEDPDSGKQVVFAHVFEDPNNHGEVILYIDDGAGTAATLADPTVGEVVTAGLPGGHAVGGEEFLSLAATAIDSDGSPFSLSSSSRGGLTIDVDYYLNPASGRIYFSPPLSTGEIIEANYTAFTGLIPIVQRIVDGDPDDRANYPGFRAAGVRVRVLSPNVVTPLFEITLSLSEGADREQTTAAVADEVMDYVNTLGISGDIVRNRLIEKIMGVDGVADFTMPLPLGNITILDNQIPRASSDTINVS